MKRPLILLVNPWVHDFAAYDLWAKPLGLLVLATKLRRLGWECRLVDCLDPFHPGGPVPKRRPFHDGSYRKTPIPRPPALKDIPRTFSRYGVHEDLIRKAITEGPRPEAVFVTCLLTYWYTGLQETIRLLTECLPDVPVILGGAYATLIPRHAAAHSGARVIIEGPGERSLKKALDAADSVRLVTDTSAESDLEFSPALDLLHAVEFLPVMTSRGCPFRCSYCASRALLPEFVRRTPSEAANEIVAGRLKHGVTDVALYDDAFLVNPEKYAIPLLDMIAERTPGLRIHAPNGLHASAIDGRVAQAMKKAGFETIRLGLESASDEFHSRYDVKTDRAAFVRAVKNLKDAGFCSEQIGTYLLVGLPGQGRSQIEADVEFALDAGAHPKPAEFSPIPRTALWADAVAASRFPIEKEPLFQNCSLLPAATPEVDHKFLSGLRARIRASMNNSANQR
jgi:radical SAM superfamily enzyme YgiQ (UPF0313 family)